MKGTLLLGTIIVAFAGWLGYYTVYRGQEAERARLQAALHEERTNQRNQADVAAVLEEIERYRQRLSPTADTSWLVKEVLALADAVGVQLTRIVPEPTRDLGGVSRLGLDLQFLASYHELGAFLDRLEHAPPFIRVDRVELMPTGTTGQDQKATSHVVLSTFYVPPVALSTAAGSGLSGSVSVR